MNKSQIAKRESYDRVVNVVVKSALDVTTVDGLATEMSDLAGTIVKIDSAATKQTDSSLGSTASEASKFKMGNVILRFALRGKVKAKKLGMLTLSHQLNEPITHFTSGAKVDMILKAKSTRNLINDNKVVLVITAANIKEMDDAIVEFEDIKGEQVEALIESKAEGTDLLKPYFKSADDSVSNIIDLVESFVGTVNPTLVNELKLTAELHIAGSRHTSGEFEVVNDDGGMPLMKSIVEDTSNLKTYKMGSDHKTVISSHHPGEFMFNISCPGFVTVPFGAMLNRGVVNSFTIRLKAVVSGGGKEDIG